LCVPGNDLITGEYCNANKENCEANCAGAWVVPSSGSKAAAAALARKEMATLTWGTLTTTSLRSNGTTVGAPFGNPYSYAEIEGVPYFYGFSDDASFIDIFGEPGSVIMNPKPSTLATFAVTYASQQTFRGKAANPNCTIGLTTDPESPSCSRVTLTGNVVKVDEGSDESKAAFKALTEKHPYDHLLSHMGSHGFFIVKMAITVVWLIPTWGPSVVLTPDEYFAPTSPSATATTNAHHVTKTDAHHVTETKVETKGLQGRPAIADKPEYARWLLEQVTFGSLGTTSVRGPTEGTLVGAPFGNVKSIADVDGYPVFMSMPNGTWPVDASIEDLFYPDGSNEATLAISMAGIYGPGRGGFWNLVCRETLIGDPENPPCARVTLTGTVSVVPKNTSDPFYVAAKKALNQRHPYDHQLEMINFVIYKMEVTAVWMINMYGYAWYLPNDTDGIDAYYNAKP
jgi:hypothetical protein